MKVALNGNQLLSKQPAGPEMFALNIYKNLAVSDKKNSYTLLFSEEPGQNIRQIFEQSNFEIKILKPFLSWTHISLTVELFSGKYSTYFTPIHTIPFIKNPFVKYICMIHGLEYKTNADISQLWLKRFLHPLIIQWVIVFADILITPSEATKKRILKFMFLNFLLKQKIHVVQEGVDKVFFEAHKNPAKIASVCNKYNLEPKKYLLSISTIQPRKNFPMLIHAYSNILKRAQKNTNQDTNLVLVGKLGWNYHESLEAPKKYKVEDSVKFLNWVSHNDLPYILAGCKGYVSVSKEEGFGLTILEAMACRVPILASDIEAHSELAGENIIYCQPNDITSIESGLAQLLRDAYDHNLLESAAKKSENYSWQKSVKILSTFFR